MNIYIDYTEGGMIMGKDIKISIILDENKKNQLEELMRQSGIKTKKDLFENALLLMKWMVEEKREGRSIGSIKGDSIVKEISLPALNIQPKES